MSSIRLVLLGLLALLLVGVVVAATRIHAHHGYFSPVFGADGDTVYYIDRQTRGLVTGLGWEFFSPPAHVFVWEDRFSLHRLDRSTGDVEILATFPSSPIDGQRLRTYRGRAFTAPATLLRRRDDELEFRIRLSIPTQPTSTLYFLTGRWNLETAALVGGDEPNVGWSREWIEVTGGDESPLSGPWEVMTVEGPESFPCAIVSQEAESMRVQVLRQNADCADLYPRGIDPADVAERSRRAYIERLRELTSIEPGLR